MIMKLPVVEVRQGRVSQSSPAAGRNLTHIRFKGTISRPPVVVGPVVPISPGVSHGNALQTTDYLLVGGRRHDLSRPTVDVCLRHRVV